MSGREWRDEMDDWRLSRAQHETDWADYQRERRLRWQRLLITDEEVRNRQLLDDEERRCDGMFDRDSELRDDDGAYRADWP